MIFNDAFMSRRYHNFFISVLLVLLSGLTLLAVLQILNISVSISNYDAKTILATPSQWQEVQIQKNVVSITPTEEKCNFFNCFNVYRCGRAGHQKLSVYIYPLRRFLDEDGVEIKPHSKEFLQILETIADSEYYTPDPENSCLFIPPIDTLNENNLRKDKIGEILASFEHWSVGENHLLFNFLPGTPPHFSPSLGVSRGKAIVAGGGFSSYTYRRSYDISLPVYNPLHQNVPPSTKPASERPWFIISSQVNIHRDYRDDLESQVNSIDSFHSLLVLQNCQPPNTTKRCRNDDVYEYPQVLSSGKFCVVIRGGRLGQTALYDAMRAGCVPIIVADGYILPFSEIIDWKEAAILLYEEELPDMVSIVKKHVSINRLEEMQKQVIWLYNEYFASIKNIIETSLKILNDRVFPAHARSLKEWNERPLPQAVHNPLFLPITAPASDGFTAVILTYDRVSSLFQVIENIAKVSSLSKILVIWNNQIKKPPAVSSWPKIDVPLKVIQTKANKLSNRFYPYEEIETECILAVDDDINMMTADELEFGYHVWREFPDRIVGFPSRNVVWNNVTMSWKYDSEWTNEVSMVLTGVAFYHKYWSFVYTTQMPGDIKDWVDYHMNCEDIAMNFLIANRTGKAPIKVTPRKKFKCSECTSGDLSANEAHLVERSQCVNYFSKVFGTMPLKTVEFRADPVLFKDNLHQKMKLFNDIGSL
ncbi:Exostosin-2 [Armadillidium nasatum]|uniref:Exostosin-2 n=1 Tax=Armadillidium nasatum TaxID=96803 RepID=A0A5N5TPR6_9CRUS|nr:Exostosin-2 [Armadillidium nasatum]